MRLEEDRGNPDPQATPRGWVPLPGGSHDFAANPALFAEGVPNAAAAQLSLMFQVKGGCQTIIGSRTSGIDALWLASLRIASGEWDRAIVSAGEELHETATIDGTRRRRSMSCWTMEWSLVSRTSSRLRKR